MTKKITIKRLNEIAKEYGYTQKEIKEIYAYLNEQFQMNSNEEQLKHYLTSLIPEPEEVKGEVKVEEVKNYHEVKTLNKLSNKLKSLKTKATSDKPNYSKRLELNYKNKREWKIVEKLHKGIDRIITDLVINVITEMVSKGIKDTDSNEFRDIFIVQDTAWRRYCRVVLIGKYPGTDVTGERRTRVLELFKTTLDNELKKEVENQDNKVILVF
jgi:hypothetical protein